MREIEIKIVGNIGKKFVDRKSKANIICAYDGNAVCSPNCAACEIWGTSVKATCNRGAKGFDIGIVKE